MKKEKVEKKEIISELNFIKSILFRFYNNIQASKNFGISIMLGVMFGILGNMLVMLIWDLGLEEWNFFLKSIICLSILIFIGFLVFMTYNDKKKFARLEQKLSNKLDSIELDKLDIKKGNLTPSKDELYKKYILDTFTR